MFIGDPFYVVQDNTLIGVKFQPIMWKDFLWMDKRIWEAYQFQMGKHRFLTFSMISRPAGISCAVILALGLVLSSGCVSKYPSSFDNHIKYNADGPWKSPFFVSESFIDSIITRVSTEGSCFDSTGTRVYTEDTYRSYVKEWQDAEIRWKTLYVNPRGRYLLLLHWGKHNSVGNYCITWRGFLYCPCCHNIQDASGGDSDAS